MGMRGIRTASPSEGPVKIVGRLCSWLPESLVHLVIYDFCNWLEYSEIPFQPNHGWTSLNYRIQEAVVYVLKLSQLGTFRFQLSATDLKMFHRSNCFAIGHAYLKLILMY